MPGLAIPKRPQMSREDVVKILTAKGVDQPVALLGVRGYFSSMGKPGRNDRGIWDDAFFALSPRVFESFNGNTDPSIDKKGVATLALGVWFYQPGKHKINSPNGYPAFVQAAQVVVHRDGQGDDRGWFGVNIHHGGNGTSSLGCQTIVLPQWDRFRELLYVSLQEYRQRTLPYVLIDEQEMREILAS